MRSKNITEHNNTYSILLLYVKKNIKESHSCSYQRDVNDISHLCYFLDSWVTVVPVSFDKTYEQGVAFNKGQR